MDSTQNVLYHYTTVSALASILKNREIRFAPLTKFYELHKEEAKLSGEYSKYLYISCWTNESKESIKMWDMCSCLHEG
jgi:hypothetical protein